MRLVTPTIALLMTALSIPACGDDGPATTDGGSTNGEPPTTTQTGPGTDGMTAATEPGTTAPGETTIEGTDGSTMAGTDGTTMAETDATTTETMETEGPTSGTTEAETGGAAAGWADCFGDASVCVGAETCLVATDPDGLQGSFCSVPNCSDVDDCSAMPSSGSAVPTCEDVGSDGLAECYLSCAAGEACPDGMECWNTLACVWAETDWTCQLSLYDQSGLAEECDCGCGLTDPDCADMTIAACDVCDSPGSCSSEACPGSISDLDNSLCGS